MDITITLDDILASEFYQYVGGDPSITDPTVIADFLTAYFLRNFDNTMRSKRDYKAKVTAVQAVDNSDLQTITNQIQTLQEGIQPSPPVRVLP